MLISEAIKYAKASGKLIVAKPIPSWAGEPRVFLMCRSLHDEITKGRRDADPKIRQRWATLEAAISHFIEGGYINENLMKQLKPEKYEHWELRSRRPKPSIRVFGRFAIPDVFVGTHLEMRSSLGGMWSPQFEHHKLVCEEHWVDAGLPAPFTDVPHFRYEKYITSNAKKQVQL